MEKFSEIKQGLLLKDTHNNKVLTRRDFCSRSKVRINLNSLKYASYKRFKLFQMDIKSAFLNGFIKEKSYL